MQAQPALYQALEEVLRGEGAVLVGAGALGALPEDVRAGLPTGVSVAVAYPREVIRGIAEGPTAEYFRWYNALNAQLDTIVQAGAAFLQAEGYRAIPCTAAYVGDYGATLRTALPHKTVATRAGLGWVGKCALLITEQFGSMIRLSSLLTDAPLPQAIPTDSSRCKGCTRCMDACPAGAVTGALWQAGMERERLYNAPACRDMARKKSMEGFQQEATLCGKCIEICPYTQRYLRTAAD